LENNSADVTATIVRGTRFDCCLCFSLSGLDNGLDLRIRVGFIFVVGARVVRACTGLDAFRAGHGATLRGR